MNQFQSTLYAYIDEYGDPSLDTEKDGVSGFFICVAVLVDESQREKLETCITEIRRKCLSGGELKSSNIGQDHARRSRVLNMLLQSEFAYYALVVDKRSVDRESGLKYKRSFYKCINRFLYRRLMSGCMRLEVIADEIGSRKFMASFSAYIQKMQLPDLFSNAEHRFAKSHDTPIIQVADFVAGTLARFFEPKWRSQETVSIYNAMSKRQIGIHVWPPSYRPLEKMDLTANDDWDTLIRGMAISQITNFVKEYENSDDEYRQMQIEVLQSLLFLDESSDDGESTIIFSDALMDRLLDLGFRKISKATFISKVMGALRDKGIILAGTNDGYCLATSLREIDSYISHDASVIEPMLSRLQKAREQIKLATTNKLDILNAPQYERLKKLADAYVEASRGFAD